MATQLSGKVGQLIYRQTKYGTVVYEAPAKASVAIAIKDGVSSSVTSRTYTKSAGGGDDEPGGDDH